MELQLVSKETAVLAKELGFNWKCRTILNVYSEGSSIGTLNYIHNSELEVYQYTLPEQELLAKWLRDVHKLYIVVHVHREGWSFNIHTTENNRERLFLYSSTLISIATGKYIKTYEESLEEGLLYALNYLKENLQKEK